MSLSARKAGVQYYESRLPQLSNSKTAAEDTAHCGWSVSVGRFQASAVDLPICCVRLRLCSSRRSEIPRRTTGCVLLRRRCRRTLCAVCSRRRGIHSGIFHLASAGFRGEPVVVQPNICAVSCIHTQLNRAASGECSFAPSGRECFVELRRGDWPAR